MTEAQKARLARRRKAASLSLQGLSLKEIAEKTGVSYTTARSDLEWIRKNEPQRLENDSASVTVPPEAEHTSSSDAILNDSIENKPVNDDSHTTVNRLVKEQDNEPIEPIIKTDDNDEHDLGEQAPVLNDHPVNEPVRRIVYSNPIEVMEDPSCKDLLKDTVRGTVGNNNTGDIYQLWEQRSIEAPDKTGEEEYFYSLPDTEKWRYLQDRLRNDRLMVIAIAFIILTVIILLINS